MHLTFPVMLCLHRDLFPWNVSVAERYEGLVQNVRNMLGFRAQSALRVVFERLFFNWGYFHLTSANNRAMLTLMRWRGGVDTLVVDNVDASRFQEAGTYGRREEVLRLLEFC